MAAPKHDSGSFADRAHADLAPDGATGTDRATLEGFSEVSPAVAARGRLRFSVLERCVGDVDEFVRSHWGRAPMVHRTGTRFDDLLSAGVIVDLLELAARRPLFRMVRDGSTSPPSAYTRSVRMGGVWASDVADVDAISREFAAGATLVMQSLERWHPALRAFVAALSDETSHATQANAYLTPVGSTGLAAHRDGHDVLVLHVDGHKTWTVAGLPTVELGPGDVMYIPRGVRHSAATASQSSLHITIGITAVTGLDLVKRSLAGVAELQAPLPLGFARERTDHAASLAAALAAAVSTATNLDVDRFVDADVSADRRPAASALRAAFELDRMDDDTVIALRVDAGTRIDDGMVVVDLADRHLRMPMSAARAMEALQQRRSLSVRDLAGLNESSRLVLARRLVREGVVDVEPASPRSA